MSKRQNNKNENKVVLNLKKILEAAKGLGIRLGQVSKLPRKVHFSFQLCYLRVLIFPPRHECEFIDFVTIQEMQILCNINLVFCTPNPNWHEAGQFYPPCNFRIGFCQLNLYQKFPNFFGGEN